MKNFSSSSSLGDENDDMTLVEICTRLCTVSMLVSLGAYAFVLARTWMYRQHTIEGNGGEIVVCLVFGFAMSVINCAASVPLVRDEGARIFGYASLTIGIAAPLVTMLIFAAFRTCDRVNDSRRNLIKFQALMDGLQPKAPTKYRDAKST